MTVFINGVAQAPPLKKLDNPLPPPPGPEWAGRLLIWEPGRWPGDYYRARCYNEM